MRLREAFGAPLLVLAGIGVGACSSVILYVCDQPAMSRSSYALLLTRLPATTFGVIVLYQIPNVIDVLGVLLVMGARRSSQTIGKLNANIGELRSILHFGLL